LAQAVPPAQVTPTMARTVQPHHLAQFLLVVVTVAVQTSVLVAHQ
jgi:hypothetical protein